MWKEAVVAYITDSPEHLTEKTEEKNESLSLESRYASPDLNVGPSEHKAQLLRTRPRLSPYPD
jgi:hypothetical protein